MYRKDNNQYINGCISLLDTVIKSVDSAEKKALQLLGKTFAITDFVVH